MTTATLLRRALFVGAALATLCGAPAFAQQTVTATSPVPGAPMSFEDLSQQLLPTVVNVATTTHLTGDQLQQQMQEMPQLPEGSPFEEFFKEFYDRYQNQQQQQQPAERNVSSLGSGFVIDAAKGYIVTNNHVIKDADEIKVVLHDDTTLDAKLIGTDEKTDIALLQVKTTKPLYAAKWGDSDTANVGSWVLAIGNPFGLGGTVTAGIVSARQRDINAGPYDDFIQTDASINRGNSGGPMFNMRGEVIGVNTAIFSPSGGSIGIGFAVPSNIAKSVVAQLEKYGATRRGWLGVRIQDVTPEIADSLGLGQPRGALVSSVVPKSPAETAGLKAGDIITSVDGKDIPHSRNLPRLIAECEVGKSVAIGYWRDGKAATATVTLGQLETAEKEGLSGPVKRGKTDAKPAPVGGTDIAPLGISVSPLSDALRDKYGIAKGQAGLAILSVAPDSASAEKGLMEGDVISEAGQKPVATVADLQAALKDVKDKGHGSVLLFVARKDDRRFVAIKLK